MATYYLCTTARRKNGKRHIMGKYSTEKEALKVAKNIDKKRYHVEIISGDWKCYNHIGE